MDHEPIEEQHTVQLYLQGRLSPEDAERFEDHYLDCPRCLAELQAAASLHRGLKGLAAREAAAGAGLLAWAARALRGRGGWLAVGVALASLLTAASLWRQNQQLERALEEARATPAREFPAAGAGAEVERLRQRLQELSREHEREVAAAAESRSALEEKLRRALEPRGGTLIAYLSPVRSGAEVPPVQIDLPPGHRWVVLALDLGPGSGARRRVALYRQGNPEPLWRSGELRAGAAGELAVSVPASALPPGDYRVVIEGRASHSPAAVFPFQVLAADAGG